MDTQWQHFRDVLCGLQHNQNNTSHCWGRNESTGSIRVKEQTKFTKGGIRDLFAKDTTVNGGGGVMHSPVM